MDFNLINPIMLQISCAVFCVATGLISSYLANMSDLSWDQSLIQPPFRPPSWLFAPVWTALYVLMGFGLSCILQSGRIELIAVFAAQLLLNLVWSPIFFRFRKIQTSFYVICALWLSIQFMIFWSFHTGVSYSILGHEFCAAWLFFPYITWVSFASVLNGSIYALNPDKAE